MSQGTFYSRPKIRYRHERTGWGLRTAQTGAAGCLPGAARR
jgi:hypothetical protein